MADPKAAERYELGDLVSIPVSRWQKFVALLDATKGSRPLSLFGATEVQVVDRRTDQVVFSAAFRYETPLIGMLDQIRVDLSELTVAEFEHSYGITRQPLPGGVPAGQPTTRYFDSSPKVLATGIFQAFAALVAWVRSLVARQSQPRAD